MSRFLIVLGVVFIVAGDLHPLVQKLGLGRLRGDIAVERESYRVYIPLGTSIRIGVVPTPIHRPTDR
ncbi:MAG: DUF2905 domain-containing protein [Proteobacteria bacterium]|nr:DUF2905 domain-containing protein [Pseudomonadota bacterium]